ncbi:MAG: IPTL-CTERM sorting domain-containing protein, partial [Betaproteobacteria bacterium]
IGVTPTEIGMVVNTAVVSDGDDTPATNTSIPVSTPVGTAALTKSTVDSMPIPTLSEWKLRLLALLVAAAGVAIIHGRKRGSAAPTSGGGAAHVRRHRFQAPAGRRGGETAASATGCRSW